MITAMENESGITRGVPNVIDPQRVLCSPRLSQLPTFGAFKPKSANRSLGDHFGAGERKDTLASSISMAASNVRTLAASAVAATSVMVTRSPEARPRVSEGDGVESLLLVRGEGRNQET